MLLFTICTTRWWAWGKTKYPELAAGSWKFLLWKINPHFVRLQSHIRFWNKLEATGIVKGHSSYLYPVKIDVKHKVWLCLSTSFSCLDRTFTLWKVSSNLPITFTSRVVIFREYSIENRPPAYSPTASLFQPGFLQGGTVEFHPPPGFAPSAPSGSFNSSCSILIPHGRTNLFIVLVSLM